MISEKDEDFLTAWVIHFSLTGCTPSVLREKLKNPSNIHFWKSTIRVESNQFDFIYFLTQLSLTKDIDTLQRIILEPDKIHDLVRQTASVRKTFGEFEFDEASYRKETDRLPGIRCSFMDEKLVFFELLVTDLLDPDNNLRGLLRDLAISSRNVSRNDTHERRDSSCVTSHNTRDKEMSPFSQGLKESRMKGSKKVDFIDLEKDIISSQLPSKSQRFNSNAERPSSQITPKKSRKRRHSPYGRKSFHGEIPRMKTIDTYFKPVPKVKEIKYKDTKENKISHSNKFEVIIVEDDDYESSNKPIGNVLDRDHMWGETNYSVIDELHSLETDCFQEDISLTGKVRTSIAKPTEKEESDTDTCATCEDLQDFHTKQVMKSSALNAEKNVDNFTPISPVNCSESFRNHTTANTDANNNIVSQSNDQRSTFKLDVVTRELVRDWCGGDTFLTQGSFSSSEEAMEQDNMNTDNDDNSDNDNDYDNNFDKHVNENNNKTNENDNDNDGDSDNGSVIIMDPKNHKSHGDKSESDTDNDKSDENSDDDDDEDDDDNDDSDNEIESDDDNDEDYVYNSEDESDSDND